MALHPMLFVPPIVLLTMVVVFGDAHRRSLPVRTKVAWTLGIGILSLIGFVIVFSFDSTLYRQYLLLLRNPLADPSLVGVSQGAAVAVLLVLVVLPGLPGSGVTGRTCLRCRRINSRLQPCLLPLV
jgi:4-amino-4-deoxy-L-arabinose transferase-like glycosyltransferase